MRLGGWHKTTLLDFPGRVACLVFTRGCNFACPYCHNPQLVRGSTTLETPPDDAPPPTPEEVLATLAQRRHLLQGVVVSGGEPTLHADLPDFLAAIRALGLAVKLDSNGSRPHLLARLLESGLLDHVALDVKSLPGHYPQELCSPEDNAAVPRSLDCLRHAAVPCELRITCVAPFVRPEHFPALLAALPAGIPVFLQEGRLSGPVLNPEYVRARAQALPRSVLESLAASARAAGYDCRVR